MSEILPPDEYRALQYKDMSPKADKTLHLDGSVSDGSGNIILPPDINRAKTYQTMSPQAAKFLLSNGSVVDGLNGVNISPSYSDGCRRYNATYICNYNNRDIHFHSDVFTEQDIHNGDLFVFAGSVYYVKHGTFEVMSLYAYEFKSINSANVNNFYFNGIADNGLFEWVIEINSYSSWGNISGASGIIYHIKSVAT